MIERKVLGDKFTAFKVENFVRKQLKDVPVKEVTFEKNPLGERITVYTSAPGLVIGREGANIKRLTEDLRNEFTFENPQIKIGEVKSPYLSAQIVAKQIANDLGNFGSQKFKLTGFKALTGIMNAGAMGVEIRITGKLPSARSKSWRFSKGYIKKTGYISDFLVDKGQEYVTLKSGVVGIKVQIMLPDTPLPDRVMHTEAPSQATEESAIEEKAAAADDETGSKEASSDVTEEEGKKKKKSRMS